MDSILSWFEIPVKDIVRAQHFYEEVLGFEMKFQDLGALKMSWFLSVNGKSPVGTLVQNDAYVPSKTSGVFYFKCSNIDAALKIVVKEGGSVINNKQSIGEFGFVAHFEDTEGNRVGLRSLAE